MGKRGPRPKKKQIVWSPNIAYGVGLFATDGCLYNDYRHLDFTSKDREQLKNFKKCFNVRAKVSYKTSGFSDKKYPRLQWGDVNLIRFFISVGLTPKKSKTIGVLAIPDEYFFDFVRGHHDGDGSFHSYWDRRWRSSFMYYLIFSSASKNHIDWIQGSLSRMLGVRGHVTCAGKTGELYQLKYAKREALKIIKKMYHVPTAICLNRKKKKIFKALKVDNLTNRARVAKLADAPA